MNHFGYRGGVLCAEDVPLPEIAQAVGTPAYVYSTATLKRHYSVFASAFPLQTLIAYSVKANGNLSVIRTLAEMGAGADIVSLGELKRATMAGIPSERIVFSGVGKQRHELSAALDAGIHQFNVESEAELCTLSQLAKARGVNAPFALRVNPDVDAKTHAKITTGTAENKFGVSFADAEKLYAEARAMGGLDAVGVDIHIGSQITDLEPLEMAFAKTAKLVLALRAQGHRIARLDLGGGLGVPYSAEDSPPDPIAYAAIVKRHTAGLDVALILEPGRLITANAGILLAQVISTKKTETRQFLIVDAAMNDLIRPALYDAWHEIAPVVQAPLCERYDVVGPICESADIFGRDRALPRMSEGDLVAFMTAGAYGAVQASSYNSRLLAPEVLVSRDRFSIVRERPTYESVMSAERFAPWLTGPNAGTL
jgi:diaminopimelate decarboxylase